MTFTDLVEKSEQVEEAKPQIVWLDEMEPSLKEIAKEQTECERLIKAYEGLTHEQQDFIFDLNRKGVEK